jgi:hypothetical protein
MQHICIARQDLAIGHSERTSESASAKQANQASGRQAAITGRCCMQVGGEGGMGARERMRAPRFPAPGDPKLPER